MAFWSELSDATKYRSLLFVYVLPSLIGLIVAIFYTKVEADGARGGAITVAISLFNLFINRSYAAQIYKARTEKIPEALAKLRNLVLEEGIKPPEETTTSGTQESRTMRALADWFETEFVGQTTQNRYLAITSAVGTLVWGFGDYIARWGIEYFR